MTRAVVYLFALILIWYVALTYGCITAHQADVSLEDPPTNEEVRNSIMAVTCLVPELTVKGIAIAVVVSIAAGALGVRT
ncbi:hypothetical protein [Natronorubrum sp. FCH18a]|uniref:hypothetical protein n=1 Tax=Natronorubrum sp. FCH18a TaxID=3447018 RepID=UPI003F517284